MKTKDSLYTVRINCFEIVTDYVDVGTFYTTLRMPSDCHIAFSLIKQKDVDVFRRNGHIWIQINTKALHSIMHVVESVYKYHIRQYWPKEITLYEKPKYMISNY